MKRHPGGDSDKGKKSLNRQTWIRRHSENGNGQWIQMNVMGVPHSSMNSSGTEISR